MFRNIINFIGKQVSGNQNVKSWYTYHSDVGDESYYTAAIVKSGFDKWVTVLTS